MPVDINGPEVNRGTLASDLMPTDEELAQQIGPGGTASPTPSYQQQIPARSDYAEFPAEFQPIMQNPQDWILHAPQPEVTQPPHHGEATGIRGLTPGRYFQFENTRTGQTITIPRPAGNTGGRSDQPGIPGQPPTSQPPAQPPGTPPGGTPGPTATPPGSTPEDQLANQVSGVILGPYAGGGTLTMDQFIRAIGGMNTINATQTGSIQGATVGPNTRSGDVSGSNTANVSSRSSGGGTSSVTSSQSGTSKSGDSVTGQSVFYNR